MASNTTASSNKRARAHSNMGRKRKNRDARKSTPSNAELFASLGEPGKPAPAATVKKKK
jgi:hypothetical protein